MSRIYKSEALYEMMDGLHRSELLDEQSLLQFGEACISSNAEKAGTIESISDALLAEMEAAIDAYQKHAED